MQLSESKHMSHLRKKKIRYAKKVAKVAPVYGYRFASMQGTPRVQFANIRKIVLSVKTFLIVYVYASTHAWHVMPKVSTQVYMLDRKINLEAFQTTRKRAKRGKM